MALSLERIIWYHFNGFLQVEIFVEDFFPTKKLLDECWEVVHDGALAVRERRWPKNILGWAELFT